jgi:fructokinase
MVTIQRRPRIGAIEAGGSKIVCSVGSDWREIYRSEKFVVTTKSPIETMAQILDWFELQNLRSPLSAIGIASFGPIDLEKKIIAMSTPKKNWRGLSWQNSIHERFGPIPIGFDTDTNAAAIAEWRWGKALCRDVAVYVTVGTGIGGGVVIDGAQLHGLFHPEFGHMFIPRQDGDAFLGICPAHGSCLEGLASGPAINQRWRRTGEQFPADHMAWELESDYLSFAIANVIAVVSPEVIIMGGGVMAVEGLIEKVRIKTQRLLAGYISKLQLRDGMENYLVPPSLGASAGVVGAFALGLDALIEIA